MLSRLPSIAVITAIALVLFVVVIKGYDYFLWRSALSGPNSEYYKNLEERDMVALPMQQMYWYPYTGAHIQPNQHYFGPIPLESTEFYPEMEYRSGKHGFFTDVDIDNPPEKSDSEFRIILIGGSSAQGWGAEYVKEMFYVTLEETLNKRFKDKNVKVRVINLSMAGSITYQNYIALNVWGHKLEPDLILSYSGGNDILVPHSTKSDAPMAWSAMQAYARSMHLDTLPASSQKWVRWLPGIMHTTWVGRAARFMNLSKSATLVEHEYANSRGFEGADVVRDVAIPQYIKAFQSIKRDFLGIPMMIAFQPIDFRMLPDNQQMGEEYAEMVSKTIQDTKNYVNDDWYYLNIRDHWNENKLWRKGKLGNGLHLPTIFQNVVSDILADALEPVILNLRNRGS